MINAGIFDGDEGLLQNKSSANNGDIVIAINNEDEATCKRFFYREDRYISSCNQEELISMTHFF